MRSAPAPETVEARGARLHRRRPDDAAVHERGAALLDDPADLARAWPARRRCRPRRSRRSAARPPASRRRWPRGAGRPRGSRRWRETTAATEPTSSSPASLARLRVAALRPRRPTERAGPPDRTAAPTMLPISPGFRSPIVVMPLTLPDEPACTRPIVRPACGGRGSASCAAWIRAEPLENLRGHRRAPARRLAHVQRHQLVRRRQIAILRMIHLMDIVDALRVVARAAGS